MANFLTFIKKTNSNLYCLCVSFLLAVWFNGIAGLLNHLFPNRGILLSLLLISLPIVILPEDVLNIVFVVEQPVPIFSLADSPLIAENSIF